MNTGANVNAARRQRGREFQPAARRLGGAVEKREYAVPSVLDAGAAVFRENAVDELVMRVQLMSPLRIATSAELFGGADDVGEQHRLEHSFIDGDIRSASDEVEDGRTERVIDEPVWPFGQGL